MFLLRESRIGSCEWTCALRLERRKELEEMAPMVATYPERTSFIASSHKDAAHLSISTTPSLLHNFRLADHRFDSTKPPSSPGKWMTRVVLFVSGSVRLRYVGNGLLRGSCKLFAMVLKVRGAVGARGAPLARCAVRSLGKLPISNPCDHPQQGKLSFPEGPSELSHVQSDANFIFLHAKRGESFSNRTAIPTWVCQRALGGQMARRFQKPSQLSAVSFHFAVCYASSAYSRMS